ncbi:purine and uridine phosphorylase [Hortaea werneckii]|nr:purine and uridine phosphorylase [Hortaea werneckii]KAI7316048.1 purine and uridine phosphorylase [Hortaea werneckii]
MQAPKHPRESYNVGIICALPLEKAAVRATLDEEHDSVETRKGDGNEYIFGKIGAHNVVVAGLPSGMMGKVSATEAAKDMLHSFEIKIGLMVGICGGVWSEKADVRLGDVVVSQPDGMHGGVVQWDYGKWEKDGVFKRKGMLNKPPLPLLSAMQSLKAKYILKGSDISYHLEQMLTKYSLLNDQGFGYQGRKHDVLFEASYVHAGGDDCKGCDRARTVDRPSKRRDTEPMVHYGNIASGDSVVKDGPTRDRIAQGEGILAFEMEAAGLMDRFPCVVIRGVCDYADSHKNKRWQPYAAATAACYCKELLFVVKQQGVAGLSEANQSSARPKYIPFTQNRQFTGRTEELEILEQKLFGEQDCQQLAVVGLGGIGKTQLVLQFAYSVLQEHPDVSVFWIHALSAETFEQGCREVARIVGIVDKEDDKQDVKELFCRHFSAESAGKWLMVVDNIDDIDVLKGRNDEKGILAYLPSSALGVTVFTTRDQKTAHAVAGQHTVDVEDMTAAAASDLFRKAVTRKGLVDDHSATSDLIKELAFLPLAITQAAAYIKCNRITVKKYLGLMRSAESDLISILSIEMDDRTRSPQAAHAVAKTWLVSFDQIVQRDPAAAKLLQYMSCIEWKAIPLSILPEMESEVQLTTAIGTLSSYSFISERGASGVYDMHRLVHVAAQVWVRQHGLRIQTQSWAMHHLRVKFPWDKWENRRLWREYMPHAIRAMEGGETDYVEDKSELCLKVGWCLQFDGRIVDAVRWLEMSLALRNTLAEDHPCRLASRHALGYAYRANGQVAEAIQLLEHVVAIQQGLAEDHPDRLLSQHELARAYLEDGQRKTIRTNFRRSTGSRKHT